jgi:hypothetical protein
MNIPLLSGGPAEDYLCCVARGLIQFVCVREGRELYRSLTADRILIHPGSVMFRTDPEYIVAGEIVRTTRMYAMSVSPLSRTVLEKLSPELFASFGVPGGGTPGRKHADAEKPRRSGDFTNSIKIGSEVFEIETVRGKKEVRLPWERLVRVKDSINAETVSLYKGLRGTITAGGKYTLLAGEKLSLILTLVPSLDLEDVGNKKLPSRENINSAENLDGLLQWLPLVVTPAPVKSRGPRAAKGHKKAQEKTPGKKELGFIALFTDGAGNYWLKCSRGFHTSLNESLSSLESLIDELGDDVDIGKKHIVNQTYRRLSDLLG